MTKSTRNHKDIAKSPQRVGDLADFWVSSSIEELARAQNVRPLTDVRSLFGTWPGEPNDGFEEAVAALRHTLPVHSRPS